jgi:hypothetical protein
MVNQNSGKKSNSGIAGNWLNKETFRVSFNVLAHEYGEIKQERTGLLVTEHLPALVLDLEKLVPPIPPETNP